MNLTFGGFLQAYCQELTGIPGTNLRKMLGAVTSYAPAAAEAVMAFAAERGKAGYLARLALGTPVEGNYRDFAQRYSSSDSLETYLQDAETPTRYRKVWLAWVARRDAIQADRRVIALMRMQTREALDAGQKTPYSLCKGLGLNRGNFYAYLNGGDCTKVSRATARRILQAAQEA